MQPNIPEGRPGEPDTRRIFKIGAGILASLFGAVLLLVGAMWVSPDLRYNVIYYLVEHFDINDPVSIAEQNAQVAALHRVALIDARGRPFDWTAQPHAIIWINQWAYWCVPCRMEFPSMASLQSRVGKDKLRIVLYSSPRDWEKDKRAAKELGLPFEMVSAHDAKPADLRAIDLGVMPNSTFLDAKGKRLTAFRAPRPWDSAKWEAIVRHWYDAGQK